MGVRLKEVDLNLRHYSGDRSDVIKEVKNKITNYLRSQNISATNRTIYSAIYNALTYYQNLSDLSITGETEHHTFLENTLKDFYEDYQYLSKKYNSPDPSTPKVIEVKGRIKSPISAMDKILEKVTEYVHEGRDLTRLNESLRDFIGLRIIVNPPPEIKAQGKQAESDFCYEVFNDLMTRKGIIRQVSDEEPLETDSTFISVNTSHKPNKIQKIMERPQKEGFVYDPEKEGVYIPTSRPDFVEPYSNMFKDYRRWPKARLYQRIHTCAEPYYAKFVPVEKIPKFIVPSKKTPAAIEYQFSLKTEEEFAEYGKAAHTGYKNRSFHRLAIPLIIGTNSSFDRIGTGNKTASAMNPDAIRLGRFDESMEVFYGYSFEDMFNIDYQTFLRTFETQERDDILAGKFEVQIDKDTDEYVLVRSEKYIASTSPSFLKELLNNTDDEQLLKFLEANDLLDGTLSANENLKLARRPIAPNIRFVSLQDASSRGIHMQYVREYNHEEHRTNKSLLTPRQRASKIRSAETQNLKANLHRSHHERDE